MAFTQTMTVRCDAPDALAGLLDEWHHRQRGIAPGYEAARLLADREDSGRYVIEVDFSSEAEARENDARPETQSWAEKLQGLAEGQPEYRSFAVPFTTR